MDDTAIRIRLRRQAGIEAIRITAHAHQEMAAENISFAEIRDVLLDGSVVENYPEHKRGPCCLICRKTSYGRYVHVVCTTSFELTIIITVYEPKQPKWDTPFQRGKTK